MTPEEKYESETGNKATKIICPICKSEVIYKDRVDASKGVYHCDDCGEEFESGEVVANADFVKWLTSKAQMIIDIEGKNEDTLFKDVPIFDDWYVQNRIRLYCGCLTVEQRMRAAFEAGRDYVILVTLLSTKRNLEDCLKSIQKSVQKNFVKKVLLLWMK